MPRHSTTLTYNPVWIDDERATKDPIAIRWSRARRGTRGDSRPLFSRYESAELTIGICTETEFGWWKDKYMEGCLHTVQMPHEDPLTTGTAENDVYTFTGVSFDDLNGTRRDNYHHNVIATLGHILIP